MCHYIRIHISVSAFFKFVRTRLFKTFQIPAPLTGQTCLYNIPRTTCSRTCSVIKVLKLHDFVIRLVKLKKLKLTSIEREHKFTGVGDESFTLYGRFYRVCSRITSFLAGFSELRIISVFLYFPVLCFFCFRILTGNYFLELIPGLQLRYYFGIRAVSN